MCELQVHVNNFFNRQSLLNIFSSYICQEDLVSHFGLKGKYRLFRGSPYGVVVNMLNCDTWASEFELQSRYYVYFSYGSNNTITVLPQRWLQILCRGWLHHAYNLGKAIHITTLPPHIVGKTSFFNLGMGTSLGEGDHF